MRIPTREEFAPIPEAVAKLGLPDPLEILPELENQLEEIELSNAKLEEVATGFRDIAEDLDSEANTVQWQGAASDAFRGKTAEVAQSLRHAADNINTALVEVGNIEITWYDVLYYILGIFAVIAALYAAILALTAALVALYVGGIVALVLGVIAAIAGIIAALASGIYIIWSMIRGLVEEATSDTPKPECPDPSRDPLPEKPSNPNPENPNIVPI